MNAMAKRRSEWTEDELDEMLASAGRGVEAISRSERFAIEVEVIQSSRPLSEEEVRDRERLERTVERAFYQAGSALQELRDRRLYRDGYDSFEDYCRGRFGHSRQKANYLITGAAIYRTLSAANCPLLPSSEYQVRPLAVLAPQQQPTVWNEAVAEAGGKTPDHRVVRETVGKYRDKGKANVFEVGEVVGILAKDNPRLKGKNNCWAIVTAVHPRSCDLRLHDGAIDLVKIEYLKELGYTEGDCQTVRRLCERKALATRDRLSRLRERDDLEDTAVAFLGILGKLQRPYLSELEEEMLTMLERYYGLVTD
ncbi:MAG: hypothetical protein PX481_26040 [Microcystis sp. M53603_WE2]|jgi:hypothetical protein|nr:MULTISPECIES: hypothetical protein [unclassified Microcystis]MCZ8026882.1 hypothetical protein [Microcystis sp. LE19-10.1B]MCZ8365031.1 hypothetical protein [Microcystis sp. LE19-251.1A]MDJ0542070.1 hypothetical protein [Microcystis sp. M53603_WE2]